MKSLFKVTLLATTMAVALNAPLSFAADTAAKPAATADSKAAFKMTTRNPPTHWAHLWSLHGKLSERTRETGHQTG